MASKDAAEGTKVEESEENQAKPTETVDSGHNTPNEVTRQDNLFSKVLKLEGKTFFLDVRANKRGQFLKLTEKRQKFRQTVILSGSAVSTLHLVLDKAIQGNHGEDKEVDDEGNWVTLSTKRVGVHNKTLYFDIMKNKYGRSLNIAEVSQQKGKSAVIVSEQGWLQLQRALQEIAEKFPVFAAPPSRGDSKILKSKKLSLKGKTIFLDFLQNDIGRLAKVSELRKNRRETLFIPEICFEPMLELFDSLEEKDYDSEIHGMQNATINETTGEGNATILMKKELELEPSIEQARGKKFNFEYRENEYGQFLKISEFKEHTRPSSVFLPEDAFEEVKACLNDFLATPVGDEEEAS